MLRLLEATRPSVGDALATNTLPSSERIRTTLNFYDYAGQDPVNGYDLTGLSMVCDADACRLYSDGEDQITTQQSTSGGVDTWTVTTYASDDNGAHAEVTQHYVMNKRTMLANQPVGGIQSWATAKATPGKVPTLHGPSVTSIVCGPAGSAGGIPGISKVLPKALKSFGGLVGSFIVDVGEALYCAPPAN